MHSLDIKRPAFNRVLYRVRLCHANVSRLCQSTLPARKSLRKLNVRRLRAEKQMQNPLQNPRYRPFVQRRRRCRRGRLPYVVSVWTDVFDVRVKITRLFRFSFCSRNKQVCKGQPCTTTTTAAAVTTTTVTWTTTTTTGVPISDQTTEHPAGRPCSDGWSAWIAVKRLTGKGSKKSEYIPTFGDLESKGRGDVHGLENNVR